MTRRAATLVIAGLAAACGGGRDEAPPGRTAPPGTSAAPAGAVAAPAPPPSFGPLDDARLAALAALEPGVAWQVVHRDATASSLVVSLEVPGDAAVRGLVTIGPCLRCRAMTAAAWAELEPELRTLMPGALEDDPATTFELGTAEVAGRTCVATYELGARAWGDELEAGHGARIYCNDGQVELVVRVDDDGVRRAASAEAARAGAARATVEEPARRLAAMYAAAM
jgi:hypothetical protein